jgi:hypothetical protein
MKRVLVLSLLAVSLTWWMPAQAASKGVRVLKATTRC